jgi:hypothetical protein
MYIVVVELQFASINAKGIPQFPIYQITTLRLEVLLTPHKVEAWLGKRVTLDMQR